PSGLGTSCLEKFGPGLILASERNPNLSRLPQAKSQNICYLNLDLPKFSEVWSMLKLPASAKAGISPCMQPPKWIPALKYIIL
ncbi:MAG: hypothetical protein KBH75_10375, partial [Saprospiraceae bacterium]|nr:hypothetical protein [Saprospiraceae bacterium]